MSIRVVLKSSLCFLGLALAGLSCGRDRDRIVEPPGLPPIDSDASLIDRLETAYRNRDYELFKTLFSNPTLPLPDTQPAYLHSRADGSVWDYLEEIRRARRMFRPWNLLPGETPIPPEFWLQSIGVDFTQQTTFYERTDLYRSPSNPNGLDDTRWIATEASYRTMLFYQLAGSTDYQVNARSNLVVIQDKTKTNDEPGKWLLYRWQELDPYWWPPPQP